MRFSLSVFFSLLGVKIRGFSTSYKPTSGFFSLIWGHAMQPGLLKRKNWLLRRHFVYANEKILQSDWSRAILMRCILFLIDYGPGKRPLLLRSKRLVRIRLIEMTPVASWLVCSTQEWVDWVSARGGDCCVLGQDTVPPPTLVYKWDPENLASGLAIILNLNYL